jgi:hypothetical protein
MFLQMDEERYTWIERDNHHVCLILLADFEPTLSKTLQILDQLTRVTEATLSPQKDTQYKHRSMLADGQRKVQQHVTKNYTKHPTFNCFKNDRRSFKESLLTTRGCTEL